MEKIDFSAVDKRIEELYPDLERELMELLCYPSVREAPAGEGAPFGKPMKEALQYCLQMASSHGCATEDVDGYMGVADLPGQIGWAEQVGILAHIDVVPAREEDWRFAPYAPVVADGRIYGRGAMDDKGPLIAAFYAGLALRDCGVPLRATVRYLFGCDEECGFSCLRHYLSVRKPPDRGFSPDGCFPAVIGEKGMGSYRLESGWLDEPRGSLPRLTGLHGGTAGNVVPDLAEARIEGLAPGDFPAPGEGVELMAEEGGVRIIARGKAAHGSLPGEGVNAIGRLLQYLKAIPFAPAGAKRYLDALAKLFADDGYGTTMGVSGEDGVSKLTNAPTVLHVDGTQGALSCDMRFPVTHTSMRYHAKLLAAAEENGLTLAGWEGAEPLYLPEEHPVAQAVLAAYRDVTGDMNPPIVMGGGTYAKSLKNFLAFGPTLPDGENNAHQADESVSQDELLAMTKIYARAIYGLAG